MSILIKDKIWQPLFSNLKASYCDFQSHEWFLILENANYIPTSYTPSWISYQREYIGCASEESHFISISILSENEIIALWQLSLYKQKESWYFGTLGGEFTPPVFVKAINQTKADQVILECLNSIKEICQNFNIPQFHFSAFANSHDHYCTPNIADMLRFDSTEFELWVDLSLSHDQIFKKIRKSYQSLLKKYANYFKNEFYFGSIDSSIFEEFKRLHYQQAGNRLTRSEKSWYLQYLAILSKEAALIIQRDENNKLVGGAFYFLSRDEAIYSVAAYDRSLFPIPVGHISQDIAIKCLQGLSIKWYKLGELLKIDSPLAPSQKEINISLFKKGFSTHIFEKICFVFKFTRIS